MFLSLVSAEARLELGRVGDPGRARQTFRQYVDIMPAHVREWVTGQKARQLRPATIAKNRVLLSAIFTTALNDQVTVLHPGKGVKTPPVPVKPRTIITPEQFAELRVRDIEFATRMLTVSRAVVNLHPRFHPDGGGSWSRNTPWKDREYRRLKLSGQITARLKSHVSEQGLGRDDLIFRAPALDEPRIRKLRLDAYPDSLGRTEPNLEGHSYRHGTMTAYSLGRCRCDYCRGAYANYRAKRRAHGKGNPGARVRWTPTGMCQANGSGTASVSVIPAAHLLTVLHVAGPHRCSDDPNMPSGQLRELDEVSDA